SAEATATADTAPGFSRGRCSLAPAPAAWGANTKGSTRKSGRSCRSSRARPSAAAGEPGAGCAGSGWGRRVRAVAGGCRKSADEALALALAAGGTVQYAAKHAGVSERTAYYRLKDADFRARVDGLRASMVEQTVDRLTAAGTLAADELLRLARS